MRDGILSLCRWRDIILSSKFSNLNGLVRSSLLKKLSHSSLETAKFVVLHEGIHSLFNDVYTSGQIKSEGRLLPR